MIFIFYSFTWGISLEQRYLRVPGEKISKELLKKSFTVEGQNIIDLWENTFKSKYGAKWNTPGYKKFLNLTKQIFLTITMPTAIPENIEFNISKKRELKTFVEIFNCLLSTLIDKEINFEKYKSYEKFVEIPIVLAILINLNYDFQRDNKEPGFNETIIPKAAEYLGIEVGEFKADIQKIENLVGLDVKKLKTKSEDQIILYRKLPIIDLTKQGPEDIPEDIKEGIEDFVKSRKEFHKRYEQAKELMKSSGSFLVMDRQKQGNERFPDEKRSGDVLVITYDLRCDDIGRKVAIKTERVKERSLTIIHITKDRGGRGLLRAASMNDEQFPDSRKLLQGLMNADFQSGLMQRPLEQRGQRQRQDAIEGVNTDFLVCPMEHRLPRDEMWVLHCPESVLNSILSPISQHDSLIGPIVAVSKDEGLAEESVAEPIDSRCVDAIVQAGQIALAIKPQCEVKDFLHVASSEDLIDLLLCPIEGGRLARLCLSLYPAVESPLQLMEPPFALLYLLHESGQLFRIEIVVESYHDRTVNTKNLFPCSIRGNRFEAFPFERLKLFAVNRQKFWVMCGRQRADKSIRAALHKLHPFFRVVSLVEDKSDLGTSFGKCGVAFHQLIKDAAELDRIGDIPIIGLMKQWDMEVGGNQKGQTDLAQVVASVLVMSPLRQLARCARADECEEVGGIKGETAQVKLVGVEHPAAQIDFDSADLFIPHVAHVIPKPLAGQLARLGRTQASENGLSVPGRQSAFAPGACSAVDGGQGDVLPYGKPLIPFRDVGIDNLKEMEFFDDAPDRCNRAEFGDGNSLYGGWTSELCDRGHNVFYSAEVDRTRDFGPAIDPAAFPDIVVRMPTNDLFCEACHIRS